jgi:hypothetical protein
MKDIMMKNEEEAEVEIKDMVDRETQAWDNQDVDKLMDIFHHDMVWPWPRTP